MSNSPSLIRQLTGAVVGGVLGLAVYYGYEVAAPKLTAWTSIPQQWLESHGEGSAVADKDQAQDRTGAHYESRAKEISERFGNSYKQYQLEENETVSEDVTASEGDEQDAEAPAEDLIAAPVGDESSSVASVPVPSWVDVGDTSEWNDAEIAKASGPGTDELPDSGIGALGALVAAGAGTGGLRMRKKKAPRS